MSEALLKGFPILSMDSLLSGVSNFGNGYMGAVIVKGLPILSMVSL